MDAPEKVARQRLSVLELAEQLDSSKNLGKSAFDVIQWAVRRRERSWREGCPAFSTSMSA